MKIGDIVSTDLLMGKFRGRGTVTWREVEHEFTGMFVGYAAVKNGTIRNGEYSAEFTETNTVRVAVLQPVSGTRYRKPVYALPERISIEEVRS